MAVYTTIDDPGEYFNTVLYTGNGGANSITGVGFQPDFVWLKGVNVALHHVLEDAVRGTTKCIYSNLTAAEETQSGAITAFDSDGFTFGSGTMADVNNNGSTFVSWNWKANGAGSSNTDGNVTTTVSANTTAGFSIVSYTGTGSASSTMGHGLGSTPAMIMVKRLNTTANWRVWHQNLSATTGKSLVLNDPDVEDSNTSFFYSQAPNSTTFRPGSGGNTNASGGTYIAYCFAQKQGYSRFGSYGGTGNSNGPFCYTGFSPAYIWIKSTTYAGNWLCLDDKREIQNIGSGSPINLNEDGTQDTNTNYAIDFLSNGFKLRNTNGNIQNSGETMVYMAVAKNPFVTSTGVPACAR
jgi:hypothetical protein